VANNYVFLTVHIHTIRVREKTTEVKIYGDYIIIILSVLITSSRILDYSKTTLPKICTRTRARTVNIPKLLPKMDLTACTRTSLRTYFTDTLKRFRIIYIYYTIGRRARIKRVVFANDISKTTWLPNSTVNEFPRIVRKSKLYTTRPPFGPEGDESTRILRVDNNNNE